MTHYMKFTPPALSTLPHPPVPPFLIKQQPFKQTIKTEPKKSKKTQRADSTKKKSAKKMKKSSGSRGGKSSKSAMAPKRGGELKTVPNPGQMRMRLRNIKTGHIVGGFAAPMRKHLHKYLSTHPHMRQLLPHEMAASNTLGHGRRAGCCCCCGAETARTSPSKGKKTLKKTKAKTPVLKETPFAKNATSDMSKPENAVPQNFKHDPMWDDTRLMQMSPSVPGMR